MVEVPYTLVWRTWSIEQVEPLINDKLVLTYPLLSNSNLLLILLDEEKGTSSQNILNKIAQFMGNKKVELKYEHLNGKESRLLSILNIGHLFSRICRSRLHWFDIIQKITNIISNLYEQLYSCTIHRLFCWVIFIILMFSMQHMILPYIALPSQWVLLYVWVVPGVKTILQIKIIQ